MTIESGDDGFNEALDAYFSSPDGEAHRLRAIEGVIPPGTARRVMLEMMANGDIVQVGIPVADSKAMAAAELESLPPLDAPPQLSDDERDRLEAKARMILDLEED